MSHSIQRIVKLSAMLPLLLGVTAFSPEKASAQAAPQIPFIGSALQPHSLLEPSLKILDQGMSGNNLQVCLLSCSPMPNANGVPLSSPQPDRPVIPPGAGASGGLPQQMMQLPGQVLQQGMQLPGQILQPNQVVQPNQVLQPNQALQPNQPNQVGQQPPQVPQGVPQSAQIQTRQISTLQQVGQAIPQIRQAIGR